MTDQIEWPQAECCTSDATHCVCPDMERALRGWMRGDSMPSMTPEQREACLIEIDRTEGYRRTDHETESDADLSSAVLSAWTDWCRDKGLL